MSTFRLIEIVESDAPLPDYVKRFEGPADKLALHVFCKVATCDWGNYRVLELDQETDPECAKVSGEMVVGRWDLNDWMEETGDGLVSVTLALETSDGRFIHVQARPGENSGYTVTSAVSEHSIVVTGIWQRTSPTNLEKIWPKEE